MITQFKSNTFTSYELSSQEVLQGSILNSLQLAVLQNELSMIAEQILNLVFDTTVPLKFAQDQAFLSGQMSVIRVMLDKSSEADKLLKQLAQPS